MSDLSPNDMSDASSWADSATYDEVIVRDFLRPLEHAAKGQGTVPRELQIQVLRRLARYFALDMRERSPTIMVTEAMAQMLHQHVQSVMRYVDTECIESLAGEDVNVEVQQALLHYKGVKTWTPPQLTAFDPEQGIVRLSYYVHGDVPGEDFIVDGQRRDPVYVKSRSCNFFRRSLFLERIVWLPANGASRIEARLGGREVPIVDLTLDRQSGSRSRSCKGLAGRSPAGGPSLRSRAIKWLAGQSWLCRRFRGAWVFSDGTHEADDNAEHLYRWLREHHPQVNAWFLLSRESSDWDRLASEGFRLMPEGPARVLLVLNAEHIVSSHANLVFGGLDPSHYGDAMRWRFTYLTHGVHDKDRSHWLNGQPFDRMIASTPAEFASIVADGSPYKMSLREARRTGLPRHDALLRESSLAEAKDIDAIFVMPTWRARLNKRVAASHGDALDAFTRSEYARCWRDFMRSDTLHELATRHGKRLVFMPHPGSVEFLEAFDLPGHVTVLTKRDVRIQEMFLRSAVLVTDYSSVAFEMAVLRRPVAYYQFDADQFFHGDHDLREGYFSYERDGFGPVAPSQDSLLRELGAILEAGCRPAPVYRARMDAAFPDAGGQACQRVFESIVDIRRPVGQRPGESASHGATP